MMLRDMLELVREEKRKKARAKGLPMSLLVTGVVSAAGAAAAGILLAPKSGKETQKWLKRKAVHTAERIKHKVCKNAAIELPSANDLGESNLR